MKLIHLSDTHVTPSADTLLYGLDPRKRLERVVADINSHHADATLCVVTGDLTHCGEPQAYRAFSAIIEKLAVPTVLMIGNHDDRQAFLARFPNALRDRGGFVQGTKALYGFRCFFLDTNVAGRHSGQYCVARQGWLRQRLDSTREDILLFMHHPPFPAGMSSMDAIALEEAETFDEILRPHRERVRHMFLGHLHRPIAGNWHGVPFSVIPGTNHQADLDLTPHGLTIPGCEEPPAYGVALIEKDQVTVHLRSCFDPPCRTFSLGSAIVA